MIRFAVAVIVIALSSVGAATAETVTARVSLGQQRITIFVGGVHRYTWAISTGRRGYSTPRGSYRPYRLSRYHRSSKYGNAPMPYSVFYRGGYAIHGTYEVRRLGRPASHGCIRLAPRNARLFYRLVQSVGLRRTRIVIAR